MEQDAETRAGNRCSSERAVEDETMEELEETGGSMEIDNDGKEDKKTTRESGKHRRSKDRKKGRRKEDDNGSKDREGVKERAKEDYKSKDSDKHDPRERDRQESSRERRKEDRPESGKDRDHEKERSRNKGREKEKDPELGKDRGKERSRDRELDMERGKDRGKDRGRDRENEREAEREREPGREYERAKDRDKVHDHGRDRDKDRERDRDKGYDKSKIRSRDHEKEMGKELERETVKERGRERGKERERASDKDRDRAKDRGREKERFNDREKEKEKDRDSHNSERERNRDISRARDRERRETSMGKEGENVERVKVDGEVSRAAVKKREEVQDEVVTHERTGSKDHSEKAMGSQSTTELQDRLIKMKEERLKRKSDGDSEILSWVSKSRVLQEKRNAEKEKTERLSKALEEQDNILAESEDEDATELGATDLAGVKILHGLDKVIEGGAVVLTLKDQNILADGDINEDVDMLENVEIGEQKQRDAAYKAAKKKTGIYDDKFNDGMEKTILPQYDDHIEDEGVTLDESGRFTGEAEKKLDELRRRIEGGSASKSFEDLASSGKISSDYYTPDEMLQFKKPRKKKSLRKKDKLDLDAIEAEAISAGLGTGDLGSRNDLKRQSTKEEEEKKEAEMRSKAYKSAYAKAEEASKALRQEQISTVKAVEDDSPVFGEDYDDLQRSLEQARKLALKRQDEEAVSVPQAVALLALANKEQGDTQSPTIGEPQDDKVTITETGEFVLGLQLNEEAPKLESEDVFMDEDVISKPFAHETKAEESGWTELKEFNKDELVINEEKEDIAPDEIIHEVPVGKGLAGAFKLLKERGTLDEGIDWGGRNMDKKKSKLVGIRDSDGPKEIHIERTDEFGRIMTPKEAFRVISHKFHGKGPGKMKQEKRMKQYQEDLKTKQMRASDTPSQSMERMREAQARLKTPYLVLSGNVKPGQTSDPRSGFATVEKDHPGSLTPMLGDKKVEHFLGIKRKSDSGTMGPPPPKKFKS